MIPLRVFVKLDGLRFMWPGKNAPTTVNGGAAQPCPFGQKQRSRIIAFGNPLPPKSLLAGPSRIVLVRYHTSTSQTDLMLFDLF